MSIRACIRSECGKEGGTYVLDVLVRNLAVGNQSGGGVVAIVIVIVAVVSSVIGGRRDVGGVARLDAELPVGTVVAPLHLSVRHLWCIFIMWQGFLDSRFCR